VPAITAFIVSVAATPLVISWAKRMGLVDNPVTHKHPAVIHNVVTPRAGGIPIFLALLTVIFFLPLDQRLSAILAGAFITVLLGTLDDKYDLSPYLRLAVMFLAAGIVVFLGGVGITFITNPFGGEIRFDQIIWSFDLLGETRHIVVLADLLAIIWIVWVMNAISWSSGVDGQMSGVAAIAAAVLALVAYKYVSADPAQVPVLVIALVTAGAYFGFLPYSAYPQRIMPGFGGATLAGYLLAVLAILAGGRVATTILVLAVPLLDGAYAVYRRLLSGHSPVWGDRQHFHHKLLDLGFSKRQVALFYWLLAATLGLAALSLDSQGKLFAFVMVVLSGLAAIVTIRIILTKRANGHKPI
jgi:UDP-GlcNAc:undecaprenyl-phosphate GlcNAc-1-phosphate transferase